MIGNSVLSALTNLVLLAGLPFTIYYVYHHRRRGRSFAEVLRRAGLQMGEREYLWYCVAASLAMVTILLVWPPPLDPFTRQGSAQRVFTGLGLGPQALAMAFLYGIVQTGFSEELLFRGLVAGSLSRRLPLPWANVFQASIFLLPHLLILSVMPEMWPVLVFVFLAALFAGWVRIRSGSIVGPWILHASVNVTMALSIAMRS